MIELAERCPGLKSVCVSNCSHLTDQVDIILVIVIFVITAWAQEYLHCVQLYGFSPECFRMCVLSVQA